MDDFYINISQASKKFNANGLEFINENKETIEQFLTQMLNGSVGVSVKYGTVGMLGTITILSTGFLSIKKSFGKTKFEYSACSRDFSIPWATPTSILKWGASFLQPMKDVELDFEKISGTDIYDATLLNCFYAVKIDSDETLVSHCFVPDDYDCENRDHVESLRFAMIIAIFGCYGNKPI